jgi:hypothetical protein
VFPKVVTDLESGSGWSHLGCLSVWTRERNSIPKQYRHPRLRTRINRYIDRLVDGLNSCYPGNNREVLLTAVHACHGLIDSTALWPTNALKVAGIEDTLTGMALASLDWLNTAAKPSATAGRTKRANGSRQFSSGQLPEHCNVAATAKPLGITVISFRRRPSA